MFTSSSQFPPDHVQPLPVMLSPWRRPCLTSSGSSKVDDIDKQRQQRGKVTYKHPTLTYSQHCLSTGHRALGRWHPEKEVLLLLFLIRKLEEGPHIPKFSQLVNKQYIYGQSVFQVCNDKQEVFVFVFMSNSREKYRKYKSKCMVPLECTRRITSLSLVGQGSLP